MTQLVEWLPLDSKVSRLRPNFFWPYVSLKKNCNPKMTTTTPTPDVAQASVVVLVPSPVQKLGGVAVTLRISTVTETMNSLAVQRYSLP